MRSERWRFGQLLALGGPAETICCLSAFNRNRCPQSSESAPGRGEIMKKTQAWFAGPASAVADRLARYADAGLTHFVIRFTGDHERQLEATAGIRLELGW